MAGERGRVRDGGADASERRAVVKRFAHDVGILIVAALVTFVVVFASLGYQREPSHEHECVCVESPAP